MWLEGRGEYIFIICDPFLTSGNLQRCCRRCCLTVHRLTPFSVLWGLLPKGLPGRPIQNQGVGSACPPVSRLFGFVPFWDPLSFKASSSQAGNSPSAVCPWSSEGSQSLLTCLEGPFSSPPHPCPLPNGLCLDILNVLIFSTSAGEKLMPQKSVLLPKAHPTYLYMCDPSCSGYLPWICTGCKLPRLWIGLIVLILFICLMLEESLLWVTKDEILRGYKQGPCSTLQPAWTPKQG